MIPVDGQSVASTVLEAALLAVSVGISVIPVKLDGSKASLVPWKPYMKTRATADAVHIWFDGGRAGLAVIGGAVSGNLEILDIEGRAFDGGVWNRLLAAADDFGCAGILRQIIDGYIETTPSGGLHLLYRCTDGPVGGNVKLAADAGRQCLIETRGEGGYAIIAPTADPVLGGWLLDAGGLNQIANLNTAEIECIHALCRSLDQTPPPPSAPARPLALPRGVDAPLRAGDDYIKRGSWDELLSRHGWTRCRDQGGRQQWRRPGKDHGVSATISDASRLCVHSTSTPFDASPTTYSLFEAAAVLEHRGDHSAAARALAVNGYGTHDPRPDSDFARPRPADGTRWRQTYSANGNPVIRQQTNPEPPDPPDKPASRFVDGAAFMFDRSDPDETPRWGTVETNLWQSGESLIIAGPTGVGKTTLAGQLLAALVGILPNVLGQPVTPAKKVLYLAMDRPRQVRRNFARLLPDCPTNRAVLAERVVFREGPLEELLDRNPSQLVDLAHAAGADVLIVDSLKDAAANLSSDETGGQVNRAVQFCNAAGVDVCLLHHQRKANGDNTKPNKLSDVYGSTWLTAGAGSVLVLWGDAGDETVELIHLKQPAEPIGPWHIQHDTPTGLSSVVRGFDALVYLRMRGPAGATIADAAHAKAGRPVTPGSAEYKQVQRTLRRLAETRLVMKVEGEPDAATSGRFPSDRYVAVEST